MSGRPARVVLLGHPVAHSLSPRFQNAALRAAGIELRYEALDIPPERLEATLATLARHDAVGNVTVPHKVAVAALCDTQTAMASRTGAVNAFRFVDGRLVGTNTDVAGFNALAELVFGAEPRGVRVALLGAGGAAAAVCAAVSDWEGSVVSVSARTSAKATRLASRFSGLVTTAPSIEAAVREADVVVNATPIGLHGEELPVRVDLLPRDAAVMDLAYRRGETPWVRAARAAGHRAVDGLEMLLAQGAHAFEWWFGIAADQEAMRRSLDD